MLKISILESLLLSLKKREIRFQANRLSMYVSSDKLSITEYIKTCLPSDSFNKDCTIGV